MRFAQVNTATTLSVDLPRRPSAAGTFAVTTMGGAIVQTSSAPTLDTVNTTLASAAAAGAQQLTVTSGTGVTVGRRYLLGGAEDDGGEVVTVRAVSGTTVTLVGRLRAARASGAAFVSARVSFSVAAIATPGRAYRVEYTWPSGDGQPVAHIPFDVVRYVPVSHLSVSSVADLDPLFPKRLPEGLWLPGLVSEAWSMICRHLAQQYEPGALVGACDLTTAHGYAVRFLLAETAGEGDDVAAYRVRMAKRYQEERDATLSTLAVDRGQQGAASQVRPWARSIRVVRA